jgi:hypothetical protein
LRQLTEKKPPVVQAVKTPEPAEEKIQVQQPPAVPLEASAEGASKDVSEETPKEITPEQQ